LSLRLLVYPVIGPVRIERRVEVDEVYRFGRNLVSQHVEVVAVIKVPRHDDDRR